MKKTSVLIFVLAAIFAAFSYGDTKSSAVSDQMEGLNIFMQSKPVSEYNYLGSVKKSLAWSGDAKEMLNSMIKKVKKDYPTANGVIFTSVEMDKADAVLLNEPNGKSAVDQIEGLYIFIQCRPSAEYDYLGSVKKSLAWSGNPKEMLNSMIKKVKKDYPQANGIIFTSIDMDKADAIKFKE